MSDFLMKNEMPQPTVTRHRPVVVYTCGTFDLFHIGHLRLLQGAKKLGDKLIVAISTDELVEEYKHNKPVVPFAERMEIVCAISCVDVCISQTHRCKFRAWERLHFDVWVVGDDWYGHSYYMDMRTRLEDVGVRTVFLPYTGNVSSTMRKMQIENRFIEQSERPDICNYPESGGVP